MNPRKQLRQLLAGPGYVITPGAYDTLTARLVQLAGFESVTRPAAATRARMAIPTSDC